MRNRKWKGLIDTFSQKQFIKKGSNYNFKNR